jgi:hypothetical protein
MAERLPEACRVVIPIKLEFIASIGFIHKEFVTMHGQTILKRSVCLCVCQTTGHLVVTSPLGTVLRPHETFLKHKTTYTSGGFNFDGIRQCGFTYLFILCRSLVGMWFIGLLALNDVCNTLMKFVYLVAEKP